MAQINKLRLPNGKVIRPTEWSSTPLYSTVEVQAGAIASNLQAFSYGLGGEVPGSVGPRKAKRNDTNQRGDGAVIQENQELLIFTIRVELFQTFSALADYFAGNDEFLPEPPEVAAVNVKRFQLDTMLEMRIAATKQYLHHPIGFFPAAMGTRTINSNTLAPNNPASTGVLVGRNGRTNSYDNRRLATPQSVEPGENFAINLVFPQGQVRGLNFGNDADARLRVRIYAGGYRRRPVA